MEEAQDAKKAFDQVNHIKQFDLHISKGLASRIVMVIKAFDTWLNFE